MYSIKFSHKYDKMIGFDLTRPFEFKWMYLIDDKDVLSRQFLERDTKFEGGGYYKLPRGIIMVLLLRQDGRYMTTIRRYTPEKYQFYNKLIGSEVGVEVR